MKKIVTVALCIIMAFALAGCGKTKTPAVLPAHNLLKEKAEQENADGITKAYIAATDAMLNYIVDEKMGSKEKLKYISFDFATNFALNSEQREKMISAFSVYGIPADTEGAAAHSTLTQRNEGVVFQYIIGAKHNTKAYDFTITVEALYGNKGYAYYYDFNIFGDDYVLVNFEQAYEKMR